MLKIVIGDFVHQFSAMFCGFKLKQIVNGSMNSQCHLFSLHLKSSL